MGLSHRSARGRPAHRCLGRPRGLAGRRGGLHRTLPHRPGDHRQRGHGKDAPAHPVPRRGAEPRPLLRAAGAAGLVGLLARGAHLAAQLAAAARPRSSDPAGAADLAAVRRGRALPRAAPRVLRRRRPHPGHARRARHGHVEPAAAGAPVPRRATRPGAAGLPGFASGRSGFGLPRRHRGRGDGGGAAALGPARARLPGRGNSARDLRLPRRDRRHRVRGRPDRHAARAVRRHPGRPRRRGTGRGERGGRADRPRPDGAAAGPVPHRDRGLHAAHRLGDAADPRHRLGGRSVPRGGPAQIAARRCRGPRHRRAPAHRRVPGEGVHAAPPHLAGGARGLRDRRAPHPARPADPRRRAHPLLSRHAFGVRADLLRGRCRPPRTGRGCGPSR
ncbi:hypothetical protein TSST111916_20955 [Tsukamurella strandjordii]